jgi:SLT domain-containing protein
LSRGDWGPLGKTLGDGLVTALTTLASQGARLAGAIAGWFSSVDWLVIGKAVGGQAFPFAIGFVNSLFDGLITVARKHPMDVLLFAAAFIPLGKFASAFGPLRSAIEHLPLGSWFLWLLDHTAVPVFNKIRDFLGFMFGGFAAGFQVVVPGHRGRILAACGNITTEIGARALYAAEAAKNFVFGIAHGVGVATGGVVRALGTLIADMIRPFAKAGGWLVGKGSDVVYGLTRGVLAVLGRVASGAATVISRLLSPFARAAGWLVGKGSDAVGGLVRGALGVLRRVSSAAADVISRLLSPFARAGGLAGKPRESGDQRADRRSPCHVGPSHGAIGSTISRVTAPFRKAGNWLFNAGYNVLWGFLNGLKAIWGKVTGWVSGIASWIRSHKGPISLDARLLVPAGMAIMTGFYNGLKSGAGRAWSFVKSVGGKTVAAMYNSLFGGMSPNGGGYGHMSFPTPVGSGVARWAGLVSKVLKMEGLSPGLLGKVLRQIQTESGGNPNALQMVHDVNWPNNRAQGLMQVIPPTFRAYHWPGTSYSEYDPLANVAAALNYAKHRYGPGLSALGQGHGYDSGGVLKPGVTLAVNQTGRPERILSRSQTVAFERLVDVLSRPHYGSVGAVGGSTTVVNVTMVLDPSAHAFEDRVVQAVDRASRRGRLTQIVRRAVG